MLKIEGKSFENFVASLQNKNEITKALLEFQAKYDFTNETLYLINCDALKYTQDVIKAYDSQMKSIRDNHNKREDGTEKTKGIITDEEAYMQTGIFKEYIRKMPNGKIKALTLEKSLKELSNRLHLVGLTDAYKELEEKHAALDAKIAHNEELLAEIKKAKAGDAVVEEKKTEEKEETKNE